MDLALALRNLWRHKAWVILTAVVAVVAAFVATYNVTSLSPPDVNAKRTDYGAANLSLIVDSRDSTITPADTSLSPIAQRAALYAQLLKSGPVKQRISEQTGIPITEFAVNGQSGDQGLTDQANEPGKVQRSAELADENASRLLYFTVNPNYPIINLYARAPTVEGATALVEGASASLTKYVSELEGDLKVPATDRAKLIALGDAQGGVVAQGAAVGVGIAVGLAVFLAGCLLILFVPSLINAVRDASRSEWDELRPDDPVVHRDLDGTSPDGVEGERRPLYDPSLHR